MITSNEKLHKMIEIARGATPGSWDWSDYGGIYVWADKQHWPKNPGHGGDFPLASAIQVKDAAHIAANSPDVVIALCEELLAARAEIAEAKEHLDRSRCQDCDCPDLYIPYEAPE